MKLLKILLGTVLFAGTLMLGGNLSTASASSSIVYDALPSVVPPTNYPSQPFQAQQTAEFGDYIHLGGTARALDKVTVTMSDWALYSDYSSDVRYMGDSVDWTHPITLNVYSVISGSPNQTGVKLATVTQTITIPWRPVGDDTCPSYGGVHAWKASNGTCYNGLAFNAVFDLSGLNVILPNDIIIGIAFNTQSYGTNPIGSNGPYNSLNVAVPNNQLVSVGNDDNPNNVFWNSTYGGRLPGFTEDTGWAPNGTVALQVTAKEALSNKDKCKNGGWQDFTLPVFKNQGQCVSFFVNGKSALFSASDSLYYNGSTDSAPLYGTGAISFVWDAKTGAVTGGYYNEIVPPTNGTTYYNVITAGSVIGNTVNLTFTRNNPNSYGPFYFTGTLTGNVLTGTLDGPYLFTATGN